MTVPMLARRHPGSSTSPPLPARMTKTLPLLLLSSLLALPLATASLEGFPPERVGGDVGPCHASQSFGVDDAFTTAWCRAGDVEVVHHRSGSGVAGFQCTTRVLGVTVHDCWSETLP